MSLSINFTQAVNLIATVGHNTTIVLRGAPGQGKSSILNAIAQRMPDYLPCYIDCTQLDLGDLAMPVIDRELMVTNFAPNARFGIARGQTRPLLIMLDELSKAAKPVLNMLLPVILERRLGDANLPTGSIIFATGNLDSDGVGDALPAHVMNRVTSVRYANPTADEWITWASTNDVVPEVLAFAKQFPQVFDCYDDLADGDTNPYIFNPRKGQTKTFCSPRSLEKASHIVKQRALLGEALLPALAGTVGESAARDMEALVHLADQIPTFEAVCKSPAKTPVPDGVGAVFLMAFMLAGRVKEDSLDAVMEYINRWDSFEGVTLFITTMATNKAKAPWACKNRAWTKKATELGKFF
jgi:hypothetical protein